MHIEEWILHELAEPEIWTAFKLSFHQLWLEIVEINAGERLRDVQFARLAVESNAIPVEYAVGRVRVLLDLKNHQAVADGMNAAAGQEQRVARAHRDAMKTIRDA